MKGLLLAALLISLGGLVLLGCFHEEMGTPQLPDGGDSPSLNMGETLFTDDFNGDIDTAWSAAAGKWILEDGRFTIEDKRGRGRTYVRTGQSPSWMDYAVEVEVYDAPAGAFRNATGYIIMRGQNDLNHARLAFNKNDQLCWNVVEDGDESECLGVTRPGLSDQALVRVEVQGDEYSAYVRQGATGTPILRSTFTFDGFDKGMPGLGWFGPGEASFDNVKIYSLGQ